MTRKSVTWKTKEKKTIDEMSKYDGFIGHRNANQKRQRIQLKMSIFRTALLGCGPIIGVAVIWAHSYSLIFFFFFFFAATVSVRCRQAKPNEGDGKILWTSLYSISLFAFLCYSCDMSVVSCHFNPWILRNPCFIINTENTETCPGWPHHRYLHNWWIAIPQYWLNFKL